MTIKKIKFELVINHTEFTRWLDANTELFAFDSTYFYSKYYDILYANGMITKQYKINECLNLMSCECEDKDEQLKIRNFYIIIHQFLCDYDLVSIRVMLNNC